MPRTVIVVNPRCAGGKGERYFQRHRELFHEALGGFDVEFTSGPGDGTRLARQALMGGAELVVAFGGDGTINEVVNGFFDGATAVAPAATFAILPAGTGGDFIRTLGVPRDLEAAARAIAGAGVRPIDVGRLTYVDSSGARAVRHFINIASFGIGGLVDRYVNRSSKALGGKASFMLATLKAAVAYTNRPVEVALDDHEPRRGAIYNVAVANGRFFGGGMKVAPDAALDDGLFDVVTMGDLGLGDLLLHGLDIYSGKHLDHPKVSVARARRVTATPLDGAEVLLDVDGEQPGRLPATFELVPAALRVRAAA